LGLGIVAVELCDRNALALEALEELEEKYPEVAVIRTNCLNMCNLCRARPYAFVNGQRIFAKTNDECKAKIEQAVQEELKLFYGL